MQLYDDYNPGGRLTATWYRAAFINESSMLSMDMRAGLGRTYRFYRGDPLWRFGDGLSYTTFEVEWRNESTALRVGQAHVAETVRMQATVTNTGKYGM